MEAGNKRNFKAWLVTPIFRAWARLLRVTREMVTQKHGFCLGGNCGSTSSKMEQT